jgi:hypothetical protein
LIHLQPQIVHVLALLLKMTLRRDGGRVIGKHRHGDQAKAERATSLKPKMQMQTPCQPLIFYSCTGARRDLAVVQARRPPSRRMP